MARKAGPLFLTYNQELLTVARDKVRRMLNIRLLGEFQGDQIQGVTSSTMRPFRQF